jgi:predicted DNA-binding transcriptional regulator AlpA
MPSRFPRGAPARRGGLRALAAAAARPLASTLLRVSTPERRMHEGRPVINRAEFQRQLGIARATAERWYQDRASNGHPEPVLREGRRLFFDEAELLAWGRAQQERRTPPPRITRDGHTLITRAELARITGVSEQHLAGLYSQRAESGHPEAVHREGQFLYFDEAECREWHDRYTAAKLATLTEVDRSGDADELVGIREAARVLGYARKQSIESYRSRNIGYFPDPDATEPNRWFRRTLWAFADRRSRPGRAGHAATRLSERS